MSQFFLTEPLNTQQAMPTAHTVTHTPGKLTISIHGQLQINSTTKPVLIFTPWLVYPGNGVHAISIQAHVEGITTVNTMHRSI